VAVQAAAQLVEVVLGRGQRRQRHHLGLEQHAGGHDGGRGEAGGAGCGPVRVGVGQRSGEEGASADLAGDPALAFQVRQYPPDLRPGATNLLGDVPFGRDPAPTDGGRSTDVLVDEAAKFAAVRRLTGFHLRNPLRTRPDGQSMINVTIRRQK
jgi:hypothetical protein